MPTPTRTGLADCGGWSRLQWPHRFAVLCGLLLAAFGLFAARSLSASPAYVASDGFIRVNRTNGKRKRVILLSSQDSGSTWLNSVLNGTEGVSFRGEKLIQYSFKSYEDWLRTDWTKYQMQLERALEFHESEASHVVGFKLMYDQLPNHLYRNFAQWLNDNGIHVLHLRRRAAILQMASHIQKTIAMASGSLHTPNGHPKKGDAKVNLARLKFDAAQFTDRIRQLEQNQHAFADYLFVHAPLAPQMELWYENLDGPHKSKWFKALFAFLGLDVEMSDDGFGSDLVKVGERRCEDRIDGLLPPGYEVLDGLESQLTCQMLYWQSEKSTNKDFFKTFYPPQQEKCRLGPAVSMKCLDPRYNSSSHN